MLLCSSPCHGSIGGADSSNPFRAAFSGARIILRQVSPESESIFDLILILYKHCNGNFQPLFTYLGLSGDDLDSFLEYAAMVLDNMGNYRVSIPTRDQVTFTDPFIKSSGDRKFIPRISAKSFSKLASCEKEAADLYALVEDDIYDTSPGSMGYPSDGLMSNYYPDSPNISKEEIDGVQAFLESKKIYSENTRLRKIREDDQVVYELLIASASVSKPSDQKYLDIFSPDSVVDGTKLKITYGDYSAEMANVVVNLKQAREYAANENQEKMLDEYIDSFQKGCIASHRESQKWWIKDISPSVETNIGFIEPYRDPQGMRAEWEGLVAIVNKEESKKYSSMVERSDEFIVKMPWNGEFAGYGVGKKGPFEAAKFTRPDYTSLEGTYLDYLICKRY
jgi:dipeptidyl-peptidase-3